MNANNILETIKMIEEEKWKTILCSNHESI